MESVLAAMAASDPSMATVGASGECGDDKATAQRTRNSEYSVISADIGRHGDDVFFPKKKRTSEFKKSVQQTVFAYVSFST